MAKINIEINGKKITKEVADNTLLSDFLRDRLALTGTHIGCDTSQWGACGPFRWKFDKKLYNFGS